MLGTSPSWGVSVVGARHENHRACDVPVPDVVENYRGQIFNSAGQAPYPTNQLMVVHSCAHTMTTKFGRQRNSVYRGSEHVSSTDVSLV